MSQRRLLAQLASKTDEYLDSLAGSSWLTVIEHLAKGTAEPGWKHVTWNAWTKNVKQARTRCCQGLLIPFGAAVFLTNYF